jgi:hypothetical protein
MRAWFQLQLVLERCSLETHRYRYRNRYRYRRFQFHAVFSIAIPIAIAIATGPFALEYQSAVASTQYSAATPCTMPVTENFLEMGRKQ